MSARLALRAARAAGIEVVAEGDRLRVKAPAPPPPDVVEDLKRQKAEILRLLRREVGTWSAEDWQAYFDERAGIAEHDGGHPREAAEALALEGCIAEWLDQHPVCSDPRWCFVCGLPDELGEAFVPFGAGPDGAAWRTHGCWDEWHRKRRQEALAALIAVGVINRKATFGA